ncbi:hypothetical protein M9H61_05360 [Thalassospira sp. GO-4]|jgi:hypothetical protein|uniref:hypothetical protein n=1 Tax=Thalassospira sp. GO-4 TaxID=2946605 RepID=UPI002023C1FB|nr:hypothetical protein [Thalassospira sp. GO-4]URK18933.1 hypothetical protein M9H61_05360 [Thalassospira sp. GO-4]
MSLPRSCPFPSTDTDRTRIWEMLVLRDIAAFVAADWSMVEDDFKADGFYAIDACKSDNPDDWKRSTSPATGHWCANISTGASKKQTAQKTVCFGKPIITAKSSRMENG